MSIYSIIEFEDGLQIVPTVWLREDCTKCLRPKKMNPLRIKKAISNVEVLDEQFCETLKVLRVYGKSGTYEGGMSKLKLAEKLSEIDTESDADKSTKKSRHKRARRISSSDDEEHQRKSQRRLPPMPSVPNVLKRSITGLTSFVDPELEIYDTSTSQCRPEDNLEKSAQQHSSAADNSFTKSKCNEASTSQYSGRHTESGKNVREDTDRDSEFNTPMSREPRYDFNPKKSIEVDTDTGFKADISRKLNRILYQLHVLNEKVDTQQLKNNGDDEVEEPTDKITESYPIQTEEALSSSESKLDNASHSKQMVDCLKKIGGSDLNGVIVNVLRRLLSDPMAEKYSWAGMKSKKAFKHLNICRVLINTVRKSYSDATEKAIERVTAKWLAQAKVRNERAKARQERRSTTVVSTNPEKENSDRPNDRPAESEMNLQESEI